MCDVQAPYLSPGFSDFREAIMMDAEVGVVRAMCFLGGLDDLIQEKSKER